MPKAFSEHEKERIAEQLLEQGYKLFSAYGLNKTNVEEIARAAGISKGAFYRFYESKEALFMDVTEEVEKRVRQDLLAAIDLPGPSPRARLYRVLKKAYSLFGTLPILHFLTGSDYDLLFRRLSPGIIQEHLDNDRIFFDELIARCQSAGIPIRVSSEEIVSVLYPLVLAMLHENERAQVQVTGNIDLLLELVAAFCVGEVEIQLHKPNHPSVI